MDIDELKEMVVPIHHYFGVSPELIWQVATVDVKELIPWIKRAIQEINN